MRVLFFLIPLFLLPSVAAADNASPRCLRDYTLDQREYLQKSLQAQERLKQEGEEYLRKSATTAALMKTGATIHQKSMDAKALAYKSDGESHMAGMNATAARYGAEGKAHLALTKDRPQQWWASCNFQGAFNE